jgi:hypothetical protein
MSARAGAHAAGLLFGKLDPLPGLGPPLAKDLVQRRQARCNSQRCPARASGHPDHGRFLFRKGAKRLGGKNFLTARRLCSIFVHSASKRLSRCSLCRSCSPRSLAAHASKADAVKPVASLPARRLEMTPVRDWSDHDHGFRDGLVSGLLAWRPTRSSRGIKFFCRGSLATY